MIIKKEQAIQREIILGVTQIHYIDKFSGAGAISMGTITLQPGTSVKTHTHKVEDAMLILEGKGIFILGNKEYAVEEGMAVIAPAGAPHGFRNDNDASIRLAYSWPSVEVERTVIE